MKNTTCVMTKAMSVLGLDVEVVEEATLESTSRFSPGTRTRFVRPELEAVDQWLAIVSVRRAV